MKKLIVAMFGLVACAHMSKAEQVKIRAGHDLKCNAEQVQTTEIDEQTMKVSACGQDAVYVQQCISPESRCTWVARHPGETAKAAP